MPWSATVLDRMNIECSDRIEAMEKVNLIFRQQRITRRWFPDRARVSAQVLLIDAREDLAQINLMGRDREEFIGNFRANTSLRHDVVVSILWCAPLRRRWSLGRCFPFVIRRVSALQHIEVVRVLFTHLFCFHFVLLELLLHRLLLG